MSSHIREIEREHEKKDALTAPLLPAMFWPPPTAIFAVLWLCGIDAFGLMCLSAGTGTVMMIGGFLVGWPWRFLEGN